MLDSMKYISEPLREKLNQVVNDLIIAQKMTRKKINELPDAAFAIVERGGRKDEEGKTIPRNTRHLPHHTTRVGSPTENTSIDKPLLRNALARMNQIKAASSKDNTARIRRVAAAHLTRHARRVLPTTKF